MALRLSRKGKRTSHLCAALEVQGITRLLELFYLLIAHLCAKIGALDPSNNRNKCLSFLMQQEC